MSPEPAKLDARALAILAGLVRIGLNSRRMEADVLLAARRAGLDVTRDELVRVVDLLEQHGMVRRVIHLFDGGILVLLTNAGIDALRFTAHHDVLAETPRARRR